MMRVSDDVALADGEVGERFVRSYGPGSQNPRNAATAVELRFDIFASSLPPDVQSRLLVLAGRHVTTKGVLVLVSRGDRSQAENRAAARARLMGLLRRAVRAPKARRPTLPVRESRLASKRRRSAVKASRQRPTG